MLQWEAIFGTKTAQMQNWFHIWSQLATSPYTLNLCPNTIFNNTCIFFNHSTTLFYFETSNRVISLVFSFIPFTTALIPTKKNAIF